MYYYINTKHGPFIKNDEVAIFDNSSEAEHFAIKYCNHSDEKLAIVPFNKDNVLQNLSLNLALLDYLRGQKAYFITP